MAKKNTNTKVKQPKKTNSNRVRKTNKHLTVDLSTKKKKKNAVESVEVGFIPYIAPSSKSYVEPIPEWMHQTGWLYQMAIVPKNVPGVNHLKGVLSAHGFKSFEHAYETIEENPLPFEMFFKSVGMPMVVQNTIKVLKLKLLEGFELVRQELQIYGI